MRRTSPSACGLARRRSPHPAGRCRRRRRTGRRRPRSSSKAAPWSPRTEGGRNEVDRTYPASSARLHRCSTGNSRRPAVSNPASDSTWASGRRRCGSAQFAGTRPVAPSAACHRPSSAASARCHSRSHWCGPCDQHSATHPPGRSQRSSLAATRSRSSRWKALPMTASSKCPGSASRASASAVTGRMFPAPSLPALAWTICVKSGSRSTAQTSAKDSRSGKASWPVPQARSSSRPCPETPVDAIRSSVIASGYRSRQRS
jgi:hypothetical protein